MGGRAASRHSGDSDYSCCDSFLYCFDVVSEKGRKKHLETPRKATEVLQPSKKEKGKCLNMTRGPASRSRKKGPSQKWAKGLEHLRNVGERRVSDCGSQSPGLGTKNTVVAIISMSPVGAVHSRKGSESHGDRRSGHVTQAKA